MAKKNPMSNVRSDIPYAMRMQLQKYEQVRQHRDEAAKIALHLACVALNNTEGLGYLRLVRFAKEPKKLIAEYYADEEVGQAHLLHRLEQIGFLVKDGRIYAVEEAETGKVVLPSSLEKGGTL